MNIFLMEILLFFEFLNFFKGFLKKKKIRIHTNLHLQNTFDQLKREKLFLAILYKKKVILAFLNRKTQKFTF